MKIVNIIGGLGNQMFQYALLVGLRETLHEDIFVDDSNFKTYQLHNGLELERIFPIVLKRSEKVIPHIKNLTLSRYVYHFFHSFCQKGMYEYLDFRYNDEVYSKKVFDCYYSGYWHNYRYVMPFREKLLKEFDFSIPLEDVNEKIKQKMLAGQSVGIHVRRGDYLKEKQYQGICEIDYYQKSIELLKEKFDVPTFYIFSNDMDWCKDNLGPIVGERVEYVDWNKGKESYRDMQLMTYCKGLIIANSSFSWWGAFLNQIKDKLIIAPRHWKNAKYDLEIQMPEWTLV